MFEYFNVYLKVSLWFLAQFNPLQVSFADGGPRNIIAFNAKTLEENTSHKVLRAATHIRRLTKSMAHLRQKEELDLGRRGTNGPRMSVLGA